MTGAEKGFLLLGSCLGNPERKPLSTAQLRSLSQRARQSEKPVSDRELELADLAALGYGPEQGRRILALLSEEELLEHYLQRGRRAGCQPITWVSSGYPQRLKTRLGADRPAVLWVKGDVQLLGKPCVSLVGSRDIARDNREFAREAGRQAAVQGYVLVSGNARGADRTAQKACLENGGSVICVVADDLSKQKEQERVLYVSEEDFDAVFSAIRALSRNRVIHALGEKVLVAQCTLATGGTWDGTVKNLRNHWSPVFCFDDGSEAERQLVSLGATAIAQDELRDLHALQMNTISFFDQ